MANTRCSHVFNLQIYIRVGSSHMTMPTNAFLPYIRSARSHNHSNTVTRFTDTHPPTPNDDNRNRQMADTLHQSFRIQEDHHLKDKVPMSYGATGTQHLSSSLHDDKDRNHASIRAWKWPLIPISASEDVLQRVLATPNDPLQPSTPSSKQPDQRSSHSVGLKSLLNPVEGKDHSNAGSVPGSPSLLEKTTVLPDSAKSHVPALLLSRSFPYSKINQDAVNGWKKLE